MVYNYPGIKLGFCIIPCITKPTMVNHPHGPEDHGQQGRHQSQSRTSALATATVHVVSNLICPSSLVILFYYVDKSGTPENISRQADSRLTFREKYTDVHDFSEAYHIHGEKLCFFHIHMKQVKFHLSVSSQPTQTADFLPVKSLGLLLLLEDKTWFKTPPKHLWGMMSCVLTLKNFAICITNRELEDSFLFWFPKRYNFNHCGLFIGR